ncbi:TPA: hypothetical protein TVQ98_001986 [Streptococcus equi subsp. zooepidemicus]|nr:hypothetical protein [Streptococcus equi subsp. zooepidemicus]HEL0713534.1 hypothetical protein [Streptococcus equi subsp. zooepidemicus]HEL0738437.1 hypothetical protein [Streptococcus equi subsp. zooepidemicus]HEL0768845.1 hypothetical protein [Streptococcus equi subsp. zooepidemicus]HEL1303140.1 hypothetical protein [Streptococcus equi subsp. zooepidemicus]
MVKEIVNEVEIKTSKTLQEISNVLRDFAHKYGVEIQPLRGDVLSGFDEHADIEVAIGGKIGFLNAVKHFRLGAIHDIWGIQIYVDDLGDSRIITTVALGQKSLIPIEGLLNIRASKEKQQQLIELVEVR